jgi:pectinesterase
LELNDNTPFFCDRDGIKKASIAEIGQERRTGYAWYTNEPKEVLKKYTAWKKKHKL